MASTLPSELRTRLEASLPKGAELTFHYIQSTPAECDPLFVPPPTESPQRTEWESHLLSVSIKHENALIHVLSIEVLVYETSSLTTIFVSKADSSGYLHLAKLPKTAKSTVRCIMGALLEHLVTDKRSHRQVVLSLFARSQAQYLFPGSAENKGKHVLDDRQLIRWWCRILDDVLAKFEGTDARSSTNSSKPGQGYVVVPGLDAYETRTYIPRGSSRWSTSSPLRQLSPYPDGPERCLIPRFPDDPKARFALDLDGELPENAIQPQDATEAPEASKTGKWRSVSSQEQFWELMAFRQECAAGRVVGFLWSMFEPVSGQDNEDKASKPAKQASNDVPATKPIPSLDAMLSFETEDDMTTAPEQPALAAMSSDAAAMAVPRRPEGTLEAAEQPASSSHTAEAILESNMDAAASSVAADAATGGAPKEDTPKASSPPTALRVTPEAYSSITSLLETLDYADLSLASKSTKRFVSHAAEKAGVAHASGGTWGLVLVGTRDVETVSTYEGADGTGKANSEQPAAAVPTMLVGRKRKKEKPVEDAPPASGETAKQVDEGAKRARTEDLVDKV